MSTQDETPNTPMRFGDIKHCLEGTKWSNLIPDEADVQTMSFAFGRVIGTASTPWVHLSLDARPALCTGGWRLPRGTTYFCPIPFTSPYTLEGRSLSPNGEPDQWNGETFISHNRARTE